MRERIFEQLLLFMDRHPSKLFARIQIQMLLLATAAAFEQKGRCILFSGDPLKDYAMFTKECMRGQTDQKRLYAAAESLGRRIRRIAGIRNPENGQKLVFFLYRNIGISMKGNIPGMIVVSRCYFSRFYSAKECKEIAAMDAGIITGICGKGRFVFTKRITEGCDHCTACFTKE